MALRQQAVNWLVNGGITRCRVIFLTDSMVALGTFVKGRSASISILLWYRRKAALSIAAKIWSAFLHVRSELNAVDKPSKLQ